MLLLQEGVYPYGYMDDWERFNEEEDSYSHLKMEDITDTNYAHGKEFVEIFK